jgi:hypothetical protein
MYPRIERSADKEGATRRLDQKHQARPAANSRAEGNIMSEHRFRVGQAVIFVGRERASGTFKITRLMPPEGGDFQYRIRNLNEPHERVVKEKDLERSA